MNILQNSARGHILDKQTVEDKGDPYQDAEGGG